MSTKRKAVAASAEEIDQQPVLKKFKPSQSLGCDDPECVHEDNCPNVVLVGCPGQHSICANCLKRHFEDSTKWEGWNLHINVECPACAEEKDASATFLVRSLGQDVRQVPTRTLKPFDDKSHYKCGFNNCNKIGTLSELNDHILDPYQCTGWKLQCDRCKDWLNLLADEQLTHGGSCTRMKLDKALSEFKHAAENFNMDVFDGHEHCAKDFRQLMPQVLESIAAKLRECKDPKPVMNLVRSLAEAMDSSDNEHFTATSKFLSVETKQELGLSQTPQPSLFGFGSTLPTPPASPTKKAPGGTRVIVTQQQSSLTTTVVEDV